MAARRALAVSVDPLTNNNPNLQHLLYLRSVTQVGLMQILQMVQLYSANNLSQLGPGLTT
jgi:hypothetical protein